MTTNELIFKIVDTVCVCVFLTLFVLVMFTDVFNRKKQIMEILVLIIAVVLFFYVEFKPEVEYIKESRMWVVFYNYKTTRKWFILWKNN